MKRLPRNPIKASKFEKYIENIEIINNKVEWAKKKPPNCNVRRHNI